MKALKIVLLALVLTFAAQAQTAITAKDFIDKGACADMACVQDFFKAKGYKSKTVGSSYFFSAIKTTPANTDESFSVEVGTAKNSFSFATPNKATYEALMKGFADLGFASAKADAAQTGGDFQSPQYANHKLSAVVSVMGNTTLYMILLSYKK